MAETYMITAKTVEEAIAIANREYADESHEVSYEIIDMPKKGFLGIGAKDAKIKVTVTKTVSLDSIVSDLRSLKVFTDKGEDHEKTANKPAEKKQNQNPQKKSEKPAQNAEKPAQQQKKREPSQKSEKAQKNENQPKGDNKPREKKNDGVKAEKPERTEAKQNQQKTAKTAEQKPAEQKPAEQKTAEKKPQTSAEKPAAKHNEQKPEKQASKPAEAKAETVPAAKAETAPEAKEAKKEEKRSSLNNQGKPQRRQPQKHSSEQSIEASAVAVSAPMGLSDFVPAENASSFGSASAETKSSGRMSNDIRKSKKNQPKAENKPANAAVNAVKNEKKNDRVIYEDRKSMITRYDVAESDDDYRKLENLEDREMTIDEIRASVKPQAVEEVHEEEAAVEIVPAQKVRREAVSEAEMTFALEFANTLLRNMGLDASAVPAECPEDEEFEIKEGCTVYPKINIIGDDTGILIGHHGETLDAIQYLVNLSAIRRSKQKDGDYVKIVVDIENYREKREETLRVLARRMAAKAVKYKRNVFLEPMNAYERRIIHSELQSVENVSTHSGGTDRDRKIIITYEGADKAPENKSRRRRGNGRNHGEHVNTEAVTAETTGASAEASEKPQGSGSNRERRRPRKVQKMPIEKIGDILPDSESAESEE